MKLNHWLLVAGAVAAPSAAQAADHFYDAMALAIGHFNADHAKNVESWGPEHKFMYDLLTAVDQQVPAVARLSKLGDLPYDETNPFRSLRRQVFIADKDAKARKEGDWLIKQAELLTEGCAYSRRTTIDETVNSRTSRNVNIRTAYSLSLTGDKPCTNTALVQEVLATGIDQIVLETSDQSFGDYVTLSFTFGTNVWRDMAHVKAELLAQSGIAPLASKLDVIDTSGMNQIGKNQDISLESTSGSASFSDPVTLRYWMGWGDCPAGCINSHTWTIQVTPVAAGSGQYQFKAQVIAESGDPVPSSGE